MYSWLVLLWRLLVAKRTLRVKAREAARLRKQNEELRQRNEQMRRELDEQGAQLASHNATYGIRSKGVDLPALQLAVQARQAFGNTHEGKA
jgi:hypothetical protein